MKLFKSAGFTLIELLIVIALIAALAIGLIATIDPFEQLKKGRDTSLSNLAAEFYNANLRAFATKGQFTWGTGSTFTAQALNGMGSDITALINLGELKSKFYELAGSSNLAKIMVTSTSADHLAVCFDPESKSFDANVNTIYDSAGNSTTGCFSQTSLGVRTCYYCVQ